MVDGARTDLVTFRDVAECEGRGERRGTNPERGAFDHVISVLANAKQVNREIVGRRGRVPAVKGKRVLGGVGVWGTSFGAEMMKAPL